MTEKKVSDQILLYEKVSSQIFKNLLRSPSRERTTSLLR